MGLAHLAEDAGAWPGLAAEVPAEWFAHFSWLHGVRHTQRVHIHARRLVRELCRPEAGANVALSAALWHDIGRVDDEWDPQHGARSVAASWMSACTSRRLRRTHVLPCSPSASTVATTSTPRCAPPARSIRSAARRARRRN